MGDGARDVQSLWRNSVLIELCLFVSELSTAPLTEAGLFDNEPHKKLEEEL